MQVTSVDVEVRGLRQVQEAAQSALRGVREPWGVSLGHQRGVQKAVGHVPGADLAAKGCSKSSKRVGEGQNQLQRLRSPAQRNFEMGITRNH